MIPPADLVSAKSLQLLAVNFKLFWMFGLLSLMRSELHNFISFWKGSANGCNDLFSLMNFSHSSTDCNHYMLNSFPISFSFFCPLSLRLPTENITHCHCNWGEFTFSSLSPVIRLTVNTQGAFAYLWAFLDLRVAILPSWSEECCVLCITYMSFIYRKSVVLLLPYWAMSKLSLWV